MQLTSVARLACLLLANMELGTWGSGSFCQLVLVVIAVAVVVAAVRVAAVCGAVVVVAIVVGATPLGRRLCRASQQT